MEDFLNYLSLLHQNFISDPHPDEQTCNLLNKYFSQTKHCHNAFDNDPGIESDQERQGYITQCYQCRMELVSNTVLKQFYGQQNYVSWLQLILQQISGLSLMYVGFFLLLSKNFRKHPYPLLAWACIIESALFFNWSQKLFIVQFKMHKIFTLSKDGGELDNYRQMYENLKLLILSWKVIFAILLQLNIVTNGLIYIDLYLTLLNPFYPRARRATCYFTIMIIVLALSSCISIYTYQSNTYTLRIYDKLSPLSTLMQVLIIIFILSTVYTISLIVYRLCKPGTSRTLRNKVIKRYILYLTIYLCWHLQFLLLQGFDIELFTFEEENNWIAHTINTFSFSIGIFLAAIRIWEPYVLKNIKFSFKSETKIEKSKRDYMNRLQFSKESLCSFMNSVVNIEFVYIILVGINKFMENYNNDIIFLNKKKDKLIIDKDKNQTKVTLTNVELKNSHLWNVDQSSRASSGNSHKRILSIASSGTSIERMDNESLSIQSQPFELHEFNLRKIYNEEISFKLNETADVSISRNKSKQFQLVYRMKNPDSNTIKVDWKPKKKEKSITPNQMSQTTLQQGRALQMAIKSEIISHCQSQFAEIITLDEITHEDIRNSLSVDKNREMVFKAGEGAGASGSFFFFSSDNRFLIKTLLGQEKQKMLKMLDDYVQHIKGSQNKSLIARIYGIFTIKTNYFAPLDVMIMQNTSLIKNEKQFTFDLKGSLIGRKVPYVRQSKKVLKDVNFLELNKNEKLMKISSSRYQEIMKTIKSDSEFLLKHGIMDYSLLVVIEKNNNNQNNALSIPSFTQTMSFDLSYIHPSKTHRNLIISNDKSQIYHIGIIDYLQLWDWNKYGEAKAKQIFKGKDKNLISAVPPEHYQKRFLEFMEEIFTPEDMSAGKSFVKKSRSLRSKNHNQNYKEKFISDLNKYF